MADNQLAQVSEVVMRLRTASFSELSDLLQRYGEDPRSGVKAAYKAATKRLEAYEAEFVRTQTMYKEQVYYGGQGMVVGIDEVGRGAVAGPLTVAAVVLPESPLIIGLNDSKKLSPTSRENLAREIRGCAVAIGISHIPPEDIDTYGMASSLRKAMLEALENCGVDPDAVLIDGNPMRLHEKETCIIKGDGRIAAIAAASIIAKVTRDNIMVLADKDYPGYGFAQSKGYASAEHIAAIQDQGLSVFHRRTFCQNFISEQMQLL